MIRRCLLAAAIVLTFTVAPAQHVSAKRELSTVLRLRETNADISIHVTLQPDPGGSFRTIQFDMDGHTYRLISKSDLQYLSKPEGLGMHPADPIHGLVLDPSRLFFLAHYPAEAKPHTLLFFIGAEYASDASSILVVGFHEDSSPYKVLELDQFDTSNFTQLDDGSPVIIGKATLSQAYSEAAKDSVYATTYDPSAVYIVRLNEPAEYSLVESKRYNQLHYVWAGTKSREDIAVVFHDKNHHKPYIVSAKDVDKVLPKTQE
jgi:hypothetical protein